MLPDVALINDLLLESRRASVVERMPRCFQRSPRARTLHLPAWIAKTETGRLGVISGACPFYSERLAEQPVVRAISRAPEINCLPARDLQGRKTQPNPQRWKTIRSVEPEASHLARVISSIGAGQIQVFDSEHAISARAPCSFCWPPAAAL